MCIDRISGVLWAWLSGRKSLRLALCLGVQCSLGIASASAIEPWNAPYPQFLRQEPLLFSSFQISPRHLDPARSYSENEALITGQVYEPPLQYHFLRRPYTLEPLTLTRMPEMRCFTQTRAEVSCTHPADVIDKVVYRLDLQPGIRYAPHPALAVDELGRHRYHALSAAQMASITSPGDFPHTGSRELRAEDYVYQIKRLAHPDLNSPILGLMSGYIDDLGALAARLRARRERGELIDLRREAFEGARAISEHALEITLSTPYPQFIYWLAMPFFAPVPWEADVFHAQEGMARQNLTLDSFPVGTGPYMLVENNPNRRMKLKRNPLFRGEPYPSEGAPEDEAQGLLRDAGRPMPFIDEVHFMLEKEDIPEWSKFLQGYYDTSPIAPDGFEQAVRFAADGTPEVTPAMAQKQIRLATETQMSINYIGFNMHDPVVGGLSARARALRQAIAIAVDVEEMIAIFNNGRGVPAHGPLPPGVAGYTAGANGFNRWVYRQGEHGVQRRGLDEAKALLARAGYQDGIDPMTGRPLRLFFDATTTGPDMNALFDWYRKQFANLGIELVVRSTDYNRFQEKMLRGQAQIFSWGWHADYPDAENFLFLLYGRHGKSRYQGENAANYVNPEFDARFIRMRSLPDGPIRQRLIEEMVAIVQADSPWIWGFHPRIYLLEHAWVANGKPNLMARNTLKYRRLDADLRVARQREWNAPVWWPLLIPGVLAIAMLIWNRRAQVARGSR
jgi:oligopeptide transport system substrate-binding protein